MDADPVVVCARNGAQAAAQLARIYRFTRGTARPMVLFGVHRSNGADPAPYVREMEHAARKYRAELCLLFDPQPEETAAALAAYHPVQVIPAENGIR